MRGYMKMAVAHCYIRICDAIQVYMKVPGNHLELHDKLSFFVVSPPKGGGEMGVYMKVPGKPLELHDKLSFFVVSPPRGVRWAFI